MLLVVAAACDGVALQGHNETAAAFTSCRKCSNEIEVLKHHEPTKGPKRNCVKRRNKNIYFFLNSRIEMRCLRGKKVMGNYLSELVGRLV